MKRVKSLCKESVKEVLEHLLSASPSLPPSHFLWLVSSPTKAEIYAYSKTKFNFKKLPLFGFEKFEPKA